MERLNPTQHIWSGQRNAVVAQEDPIPVGRIVLSAEVRWPAWAYLDAPAQGREPCRQGGADLACPSLGNADRHQVHVRCAQLSHPGGHRAIKVQFGTLIRELTECFHDRKHCRFELGGNPLAAHTGADRSIRIEALFGIKHHRIVPQRLSRTMALPNDLTPRLTLSRPEGDPVAVTPVALASPPRGGKLTVGRSVIGRCGRGSTRQCGSEVELD